jgi:hypothetical protein
MFEKPCASIALRSISKRAAFTSCLKRSSSFNHSAGPWFPTSFATFDIAEETPMQPRRARRAAARSSTALTEVLSLIALFNLSCS